MKKLAAVAFFGLVVVFASCSSGSEETPISNAPPIPTIAASDDAAKRNAEFEEENRRRDEGETQWALGEFRDAFSNIPDASWLEIAKGKTPSDICDLRSQLYAMSSAIATMQEGSFPHLTWNQVSIEEPIARFAFVKSGLAYAQKLRMLLESGATLPNLYCGEGEGTLYLRDAGALGYELTYALSRVGAKPEDIGWSTEKFRDSLRNTLRREFARRRTKKEHVVLCAEIAMQDWKFTEDELGLTKTELDEIKKNRG